MSKEERDEYHEERDKEDDLELEFIMKCQDMSDEELASIDRSKLPFSYIEILDEENES